MSTERLLLEAQRWLAQAHDDLQAAEILMERGKHAQASFYAQQSAEKGVKAVWRALDQESLGHSITRLITTLPTGKPRDLLAPLLDEAKLLDRHYIPTRYPDSLPDLTPSEAYGRRDAEAAIAAARSIIQGSVVVLEQGRE
ncbi:MAG: HEPN domain-containing protein [Trueperaceae bacterium]